MGYIKTTVSNTSTLITFYRTSTFYSLLKIVFDNIWIPEDCWKELISGNEEVDRRYADRLRIVKDQNTFLIPVKVSHGEKETATEIVKVASEQNMGLHLPEALSISIALHRDIKSVLTDDKVALQILENYKAIQGINTVLVIAKLIENYAIFFLTDSELNKFIEKFEMESKVYFSRESRLKMKKVWERTQRSLQIEKGP